MSFLPRHAFPPLPSLPRSYFLGHHKSGLSKMKSLLSTIDLVIECRDYRVPLTSRNPLFESALEGKERVVVYTKRDLGGGARDTWNEEVIKDWHKGTTTLFVRNGSTQDDDGKGEYAGRKSVAKVLDVLRDHARARWKLVGHRCMIIGMPNVGKSTLLNALRAQGISKGKVAATGAQPGVTRKVSSGVKIVPSEDDVEGLEPGMRGKLTGVGGGIYLLDTPGVFIPYVPDAHAMMKLALCGSVKDTIIPPVMLADYLLYHINIQSPTLYADYCGATNDIVELLSAIAQKTGRLGKGGAVDTEATALWMIQRWRTGQMGRFLLDQVDENALEKAKVVEEGVAPSMNQARRLEREKRRERNRARGER
ncbi:mitochondrial GTPase-like protein [Setomelanomma holmii]|uniref:Mitochondrial GTPase-like protein n=1 Tax=Setomelanomma holmii TaxID=210430 RepID=A0A9P4LKF7_9PLEO|nr:mitochondrial GTPase-like protein [Setomelanomma holmii]